MAEREQFFTFSWAHLAGIILVTVGAWLSEGPLFVVVVVVIALTVVGVYYAIWRWLQNRSTDPSRPR